MVISLIVLGFSQVSRRNSRQALDRQLSSQAYYAAESAVNDALYTIAKTMQTGGALQDKTSCDVTNDAVYARNKGNIQNAPGVKYTCLKVKTKLNSLQYSKVSSPVIVPLDTADNAAIDTTTITWSRRAAKPDSASLAQCRAPGVTAHPDGGSWARECPFGILRVDIIPEDPSIIGNFDNAAANTMTVFLYPAANGGVNQLPYYSGSANAFGNTVTQGATLRANCNEDECKVDVTGMNFASAYMRVQSLYVPAQNLEIASSAPTRTFENGQVEIDATGKAQDVLRRINVRYPLIGSSRDDVPNFTTNALQSADSICKYFSVAPDRAGAGVIYDVKDPRCN